MIGAIYQTLRGRRKPNSTDTGTGIDDSGSTPAAENAKDASTNKDRGGFANKLKIFKTGRSSRAPATGTPAKDSSTSKVQPSQPDTATMTVPQPEPELSHGEKEAKHQAWDLLLDDKHYETNPESIAFFKKETGIDDDEALKLHIMQVQAKAFKIFPYPCIRIFEFMRLKLARLPAYDQVLKLGKEREGAIFVDLGCCFGNDSRKLVQDGYPVQNVIATDLRQGLWDLGHELFKSTPESYPVPFLEGDVFDPNFLTPLPGPPWAQTEKPSTPKPDIHSGSLKSLNDLRGHVSGVFTGALFHLFNEELQLQLARELAGLLSPEPGSILIGVQGGKSGEKGYWQATGSSYKMWCHTPETWVAMWEEVFGGPDKVEVKAALRKEVGGDDFFGMFPGNKNPYHVTEWSVIRK